MHLPPEYSQRLRPYLSELEELLKHERYLVAVGTVARITADVHSKNLIPLSQSNAFELDMLSYMIQAYEGLDRQFKGDAYKDTLNNLKEKYEKKTELRRYPK